MDTCIRHSQFHQGLLVWQHSFNILDAQEKHFHQQNNSKFSVKILCYTKIFIFSIIIQCLTWPKWRCAPIIFIADFPIFN